MEFEKVNKEHILQGIKDYKDKGLPKDFGPSSTYDLVYEGEYFPPKAIMVYANYHAIGKEIKRYFKGGKGTDCFNAFERNGFILEKKGASGKVLEKLIRDYKARITLTKLEKEAYKWMLLNEFKGRPDVDAADFHSEVKSVKFQNLIYAMGIAVIQELCKMYPEEMRTNIRQLFDEKEDLAKRISNYSENTLTLYRNAQKKLSHHQDERTAATLLAYHDANSYPLYKDSFYKKFCKLLKIDHKSKGGKYVHYKTLLNDFIEEYIIPDSELIAQVKSYLPDNSHPDNGHYILAQDILYQMLDQASTEINYWVFQANPDQYKIEEALRENKVEEWTVSAHSDRIKKGDKVIIWVTGKKSGCYALGEVTDEPFDIESDADELWKKERVQTLKAGIVITHNFVNSPILKETISQLEELADLKVGSQGTNFTATKKEYQTILALAGNNSVFFEVKNKFQVSIFENYIKFLRKITTELNIKPNDERVVFSITDNRLNFTVGQRYALNLYSNHSKGVYGVISKQALTDKSEQYDGTPPQPFYTYYYEFSPQNNDWISIIESVKDELNRTTKSGYRKYNNTDFENYVFEISNAKPVN